MKISLSDTFATLINVKLPKRTATGKPMDFQFEVDFKFFPQNDETKAELEKLQTDKGARGLLDYAMTGVRCITPAESIEWADEKGQVIPLDEFVKQQPIFLTSFVMSFWDEMNKPLAAKNSKPSR